MQSLENLGLRTLEDIEKHYDAWALPRILLLLLHTFSVLPCYALSFLRYLFKAAVLAAVGNGSEGSRRGARRGVDEGD